MKKNIIVICDFPHSNYEAKPLNDKMIYMMEKCPPKGSLTKSLVGKTKTSEQSRELGEITTGKYLSEGLAIEVVKFFETWNDKIDDADIIICMGSVSSKLMTGHGVRSAVGRLHNIDGKDVYCTWHPNQIFASDRIRRDFKAHMIDIQNLISQRDQEDTLETKCVVIKQEELGQELTRLGVLEIAIDCETSRFQDIDIVSVDCGLVDDQGERFTWLVEIPDHEFADDVLHGKHLVFQKGTYDIPFLMVRCGLDLEKVTWSDISYASRLGEPDQLYGLSEQQKRHAPDWPQWKQFRGK